MDEFEPFLRTGPEFPPSQGSVYDVTDWHELIKGDGRMTGRDFSRIAVHDLPRAMAFLVGFATSFPKDRRPQTPEQLLGLVDWESPEDVQAFVDAVTAARRRDSNDIVSPQINR